MSKQQERDIEILEIVLRNKQHVNFFADNELGAIQRLLDRVKDLELHCKHLNEGNAITIKAAAQTQEQLGELQQIFDLRFKADMRAIKVWQTATGKDMKLPDHADLCVWLLQQRDAALKLARDFAGYSENASKLGLTGAASAFCQCAKELRLALAPKEGK